jgi:WD40 repeat protein
MKQTPFWRTQPLWVLRSLAILASSLIAVHPARSAAEPNDPTIPGPATRPARLVTVLQRASGDFASFSPDGSLILTSGPGDPKGPRGDDICVWDATTFRPLFQPVRHERYVSFCQFLDNRRFLAVGGTTNAYVRDARTGEKLLTFSNVVYECTSCAASPNGQCIALTIEEKEGKSVRVFDSATGRPVRSLPYADDLNYMTFSPDASQLLTDESRGPREHTFRVWNLSTGEAAFTVHCTNEVNAFRGHGGPGAFSPSGKQVAIASQRSFALYDSATGVLAFDTKDQGEDPNTYIHLVQFTADGSMIFVIGCEQYLWDAKTGKPVAGSLADSGPQWALSHDGTKLARNEGVRDLLSQRSIRVFTRGLNTVLAFSRDDRRIATSDPKSKETLIWDVSDENSGRRD